MDAVTVESLSKSYGGLAAVENVSLRVREGEILGILGPNGAGKTTTVECIQGLRKADRGRISVLGRDPQRDRASLRGLVGSQLQQSALPDRMKVWEALDLFASLVPDSADPTRMLSHWGLAGKEQTRFGNLSGGERQRLFVALSLINNPQLVFLDEMTTGLDPASRRVAWDLIKRIQERGTTVVLVTHFMDEAEMLCDRLLVFRDGQIVAGGTPSELIERYGGGVRVRFEAPDTDVTWLGSVPHVEEVSVERNHITVLGSGPVLMYVAAELLERGIVPPDLRAERASLEEVFLRLSEPTEPQ